MSQWTHVAGCIRVDGLELIGEDVEGDIKSAFGTSCTYEDLMNGNDYCTIPCGSEGSVQYRIEKTGQPNWVAWGGIYIWGDLRSYNNVDEIYNWIKNACSKLSIRQCSVLVEVESDKRYLIYDKFNDDSLDVDILLKELD